MIGKEDSVSGLQLALDDTPQVKLLDIFLQIMHAIFFTSQSL